MPGSCPDRSNNPANPERVYPERSRREGHERGRKGGRRPGAGAPKGNLNAVKTGSYSIRLKAIAKALSEVPAIRDMLIETERRQSKQQRKAQRLALQALQDIVSGIPDVNNPLIPYLIGSLPNSEVQKN